LKIIPTFYIRNGLAVPSLGAGGEAVDPLALADSVLERGISRMTLVDVDAADGTGQNREVLGQVMRRVRLANSKACLQVGGGIRSSDQAQYFLDLGAAWLMVGTLLHLPQYVVEQLLARFRDHLTASIDALGGEARRSGWGEPVGSPTEAISRMIREYGFPRVLFMDIPGTRPEPPDFHTAQAIAETCKVPLFMGGSLRTREHFKQAAEVHGLQGILVDVLHFKEDPSLLDPLPLPAV
jgi:phosphoribosylformimino-5-aminoimidazole carboxamide ribotide isomerase